MESLRHVFGFATVVLAASLAPAADVDPRLPADTEVVVSVNLSQLFNSPLGAKYLRTVIDEALKQNPQGQEVLTYIGLDPVHDITQMTLAMTSAKNKDGLVIVRGKFNRAKIGDLAEKVAAEQKDKLAIRKDGAATVYEIAGEQKMFATFPDDSTLLLSKDRARFSSPAGKPKPEISSLIAKADGKQAIWFVASPDATGEIKNLESVDGIIGVIKVESSVRLELALNCKTAQSAVATSTYVNELLGLAKSLIPQAVKDKPELSPLLEVINSIRASAREKLAVVTAEVSAEQIEKAIKSYRADK